MVTIDQFLSVIEAYARATKLAEPTIATRLFNDGKGIARLREGRDIGVRKLEGKLIWLSENWPDGTAWPDDVVRPKCVGAPIEAEAT